MSSRKYEPLSSFTETDLRYVADRGSRRGVKPKTLPPVAPVDDPHRWSYEDLQYANDRRALYAYEDDEPLLGLRPTERFEPDYDEDPADAVRTPRPIEEFPAAAEGYPNVVVGRFYMRRLAMAERWLEYRAARVPIPDALVLLAVEFDEETEEDVTNALAWMGIEEWMTPGEGGRSRANGTAVQHGRLATYKRLGCRCNRCRTAMEEHRERVGLTRKIPYVPDPPLKPREPGIPHGTNNGYANYGCRCGACRAASKVYREERKRRIEARERDAARLAVIARLPAL